MNKKSHARSIVGDDGRIIILMKGLEYELSAYYERFLCKKCSVD